MAMVNARFYKFQVGKIYEYDTEHGDVIYVLDIRRDEYNPKNSRITFIDSKDSFGYYSDEGMTYSETKYSKVYTASLTTEYLGSNTFAETIPNRSVSGMGEIPSKNYPKLYACARRVKAKLSKKM